MNQEEYDQIIQKHKPLIDKATQIMETVEDVRHSLSHVESVVKYTMEILEHEEKANKEICIISAYWHDVRKKYPSKRACFDKCRYAKRRDGKTTI